MDCFNVGYQGKSLPELCSKLAANAVAIVVDVREHAWSQRPEFRKEVLKNTLADFGISYFHCKIAGNPFRPRKGEKVDFDACAKLYAQHLKQTPEVLDAIEQVVGEHRAALLCYEKERSSCHRDILLAALVERNPRMKIVDL